MPKRVDRLSSVALPLLGVAALIGLVHRHALDAWFWSDDYFWLAADDFREVTRSFVGSWGFGAAYRPLARLWLWLERAAFGEDAHSWHATSLVLFAVVAALFATLLVRLTRDLVFAFAAASVLVVLPHGHESVVWVSGQMHLLNLVFALGCLLFLDAYLVQPTRVRAVALGAAYVLALLTYEAAVLVPMLAAIVVAVRPAPRPSLETTGRALALLVFLTMAYAAVRFLAVGTETLYPVRPLRELFSAAFAHHLRTASDMFFEPILAMEWLPAALLAAAFAGAHVAPRLLAAAAIGAVVAVIAYLPFVLVEAYVSRFFFASGFGLAVAIGALVAAMARVPRIGPILALLLLALAVYGLGRQTQAIVRGWVALGDFERRILAAAEETCRRDELDRVLVLTPGSIGDRVPFFNSKCEATETFAPSCPCLQTVPDGRHWLAKRIARLRRRHGAAWVRKTRSEGQLVWLTQPGSLIVFVDPRTSEVRQITTD